MLSMWFIADKHRSRTAGTTSRPDTTKSIPQSVNVRPVEIRAGQRPIKIPFELVRSEAVQGFEEFNAGLRGCGSSKSS